ncbi:hypothetical protein HELRODRAFT_174373 [Helobdella robusta]|uniref:Uncharacterized protein n=1 Tax=Helobdella robusta TaxID=6412 RepID=T1F818_HELRO|nr:hypothetical protein HELRODRAFT_174373 [Helobdella robusta]ESO02909.1 hypothetical protein HELRODRAFT_174373 [Helobdella robusta]
MNVTEVVEKLFQLHIQFINNLRTSKSNKIIIEENVEQNYLTFAEPGSLKGEKILSLIKCLVRCQPVPPCKTETLADTYSHIKVPFDVLTQDKNLTTLCKSIQSDQVRLLWLRKNEEDFSSPGILSVRTPTTFYVAPFPDDERSPAGPIRRETSRPWRLRKHSIHKNIKKKEYLKMCQQSPVHFIDDNKENKSKKKESSKYLKEKIKIFKLNVSASEDSLVRKCESCEIAHTNTSVELIANREPHHYLDYKCRFFEDVSPTNSSQKDDLPFNNDYENKTTAFSLILQKNNQQQANYLLNEEEKSAVEQSNALLSYSAGGEKMTRARCSTPAGAKSCNSQEYYSTKVQPLPYLILCPPKPRPHPIIIHPTPWMVQNNAQTFITPLLSTPMFFPSYRAIPNQINVSDQNSSKCMQSINTNLRCLPNLSTKFEKIVSKADLSTNDRRACLNKSENFFAAKSLQSQLTYLTNSSFVSSQLDIKRLSKKFDQSTQTEQTDKQSCPNHLPSLHVQHIGKQDINDLTVSLSNAQQTFMMNHYKLSQTKMSDIKFSLLQMSRSTSTFAFPLNSLGGSTQIKNYGVNCFPIVQFSSVNNNV